jgi:hypothetical protein
MNTKHFTAYPFVTSSGMTRRSIGTAKCSVAVVNYWADFGGNAFRDGLRASLNTEQIVYARAMLLGHAPPREDIPCATCVKYRAMRERGRWLDRNASRALMLKKNIRDAKYALRLKILGSPLARRIVLRLLRKEMPIGG